MHIKLLCLAAMLGTLVACAGETATQDPSQDPAPTDPAAATSDEQNLIGKKKCGAFLHGTCPSGYSCDMSGIPHGNVGGAGGLPQDLRSKRRLRNQHALRPRDVQMRAEHPQWHLRESESLIERAII